MSNIIKKVELQLGKRTISLTVDEAKQLKEALDELFGQEAIRGYPQCSFPGSYPVWPGYPTTYPTWLDHTPDYPNYTFPTTYPILFLSPNPIVTYTSDSITLNQESINV